MKVNHSLLLKLFYPKILRIVVRRQRPFKPHCSIVPMVSVATRDVGPILTGGELHHSCFWHNEILKCVVVFDPNPTLETLTFISGIYIGVLLLEAFRIMTDKK